MKKKSLYDIAMGKKQNKTIENEDIIIARKKSFLLTIFEILVKIFRLIIYISLMILLTIGATVVLNNTLREQMLNIIQTNL